ncbi:bile acid:sodium symporter family protein [Brachybacterium huguangmaarense]|uniref:Bile acid:sodium symporter family protein n=1 Tax=Brachybacterium huguangmaarense TaxID=1652028 RepID=A0ABY6G3H4_9MICO|nr:bile acid:sodium symporter family protein [Brachybacterium huguangmaarense]UYG17770.1 bile acid:sodium symporter family protein [Brachybacterium huguangmaarense]
MSSPGSTSSSTSPGTAASAARVKEDRSARVAVTIFPLLVFAAAAIGFFFSGPASSLGPAVNPLLGVIMFGMGLTLTLSDFALVARRPVPVLIGVVAQYLIMPLIGLGVATLLQLPPALAAGVILVGCAPGGTASNVVSYLAKADTALSVAMTSVSTLLAPLLTPVLTLWLAGQYMPVEGGSMAMSIVKIVLLPVIGGLVIRLLLSRLVDRILPVLPWISVLAISFVVAAVVGKSADQVAAAGALVLVAVILHNGLGYALGYGFARLLRQPVRSARTVSIEVGMQNSGLAAGLAAQYFSPAAALPGAVFSIWHNLSGAILAALYRRSDARRAAAAQAEATEVSASA